MHALLHASCETANAPQICIYVLYDELSRTHYSQTHLSRTRQAYITTKALNEFDPAISGVNWRQKLESQRAAVLANELKNNRNKLARWTCQVCSYACVCGCVCRCVCRGVCVTQNTHCNKVAGNQSTRASERDKFCVSNVAINSFF